MIQVAIIADIHANIPALEAVIEDLTKRNVDEVIVAGDLVGRGPQGSAVVKRIRAKGWTCVKGNHEDYLINFRKKNVPNEWLSSQEWAASRWMARELDQEDIEYISSFPFSTTSALEPTLRIVHGSPVANNNGIGHWTKPETIRAHFDMIEENILACAHTHRPFHHRNQKEHIINVGSVGLPFNKNPAAQYAVLSFCERTLNKVEFCKVPYDRELTLSSYESSGFLQHGGVTAYLLQQEILNASAFLVPFLRWVISESQPHTMDSAEHFVAIYKEKRHQYLKDIPPDPQNFDISSN